MFAISLLLASILTMPVDLGQHPYQTALQYCADKGGLAQYTPKGDEVEFSCGNDISRVLVIQAR